MNAETTYEEFAAAMDAVPPTDHGLGSPHATPAAASEDGALALQVDSIEEFAAVEEPGAEALLGDDENVLIPEGGDVMVYGDGGAGKTTLMVDCALHLGAASDWLDVPVQRPVSVLLIENEGPRSLLRAKLRRKLQHWEGPSIEGRVRVLTAPWARLTFAEPQWRAALARTVEEHQVDVIVAGPLTRMGMDAAGTLQEVVAFMGLVADVRARCSRHLTVVLIHHENKGGSVSGAWEGAGDTLLHVTAAGPGQTVVTVQKARWASSLHGQTLHLAWKDGEGFALQGERNLPNEIEALLSDGTWRTVKEISKELKAGDQRVREVLDGEPPLEGVEMRTGEGARALGRNVKSRLYGVGS